MSGTNDTSQRHLTAETERDIFRNYFMREMCGDESPWRLPRGVGRSEISEAVTRIVAGVSAEMDGLHVEYLLSDHAFHWLLLAQVRGEEVEIPLAPVSLDEFSLPGVQAFFQEVVNAACKGLTLTPAGLARAASAIEDTLSGCFLCEGLVRLEETRVHPTGVLFVFRVNLYDEHGKSLHLLFETEWLPD